MRQDYILRTIERLIQAIAQVILQRESGQTEAALHQVLHTLHHQLGLELGQLAGLSPEAIHQRLTHGETPVMARDKCLAFAALNRQVGLIYLERGAATTAQAAFHLALIFAVRGQLEYPPENPPPFAPDVDELIGRLSGFELPDEARRWVELRAGRRSGATQVASG
jgi:hypothetical protein